MKGIDVPAELRAEIARQGLTAAKVAEELGHRDRGRRLRRQLRGEQDLTLAELLHIGRALGLSINITFDREGTA